MVLFVIGSKGLAETRSKRVVKYTQCRIVSGIDSLTIDAGNVIKTKSDLYLITHLHEDHIAKFHTIPIGSNVWVPDNSFISRLSRKNPDVRFRVARPRSSHKFGRFLITPFEVQHSATTKTYGYRIEAEGISLVWLPDYRNLLGVSQFLNNLDYLFIGASALRKDIIHRDHKIHGQMAIINSLGFLKMRRLKFNRIFLIHYGIGLSPILIKTEFVNKQFPEYEVLPTWDKKIIKLT